MSILLADAIGTFNAVDNWVQARRYSLVKKPVDSNIVVVAIDSKSIARIGQWPWSRNVHAQIVNKLAAMQAKQIALDIDFSSASPVAGDEALQQSLKAAGGSVILAGFRQSNGGALTDTVPLHRFSDNAWIASVSVRAGHDGIVRHVPFSETLAGQPTPSLAAYLAQAHNAGSADINVDFAISTSSFRIVSVIDLLQNRVPASVIAGRDVIVGATAVELRDLFLIPTGEIIPGSVLQALAAETAKLERSIVSPGLLVRGFGLGLIGLLGLLVTRRSWTAQLLVYGTALLTVELAAVLLQGAYQISLATSGWLLALAGLATASTLGELDFRKFRIGSIQVRLGATKALLQEVIADNPSGIIVIDDRNKVRVANSAARRLLDIGNAEYIGMLVTDAFPPALAQMFDTSLLPEMGFVTEPRHGQFSLLLSNSTRVFEYTLTKSTVANEEDGLPSVSAKCLTFQDVTERHDHIQHLSYLALHDTQTGSGNRNSFIRDLEQLAGQRKVVAVAHMGIDRFRYINEDFGHEVGDQLLKLLAARSQALLANSQQLYRVAGDEFACIVTHDAGASTAEGLAQLMLALGGTVQLGPYKVPFTLSVGLASTITEDWSADEIVRKSDLALASAKTHGGNRVRVFDAQLDEAAARRKALESALIGAMDRQEFHLLYQPQFDLASGLCTGVESLLRWTNPTLGNVSPSEFIPVAEQIGTIEEIGAWVIQKACHEISRVSRNIVVAVNVSSRQLVQDSLARSVADALSASGLPPQRLELEITESVFAENKTKTIDVMQHLRRTGITIALDDFGTGYSSLSYLLHLPLDKIKIDKSFITALPHDPKAIAVLRSIIGVAQGLDLPTIAEGVETTEQREALKEAGCHQGQGYLFAKPMRIEALSVFLEILGLGNKEGEESSLLNRQKISA